MRTGTEKIKDALTERGYCRSAEVELPNGGIATWYAGNGNMLILHEYPNDDGCELYGPLDKTNSVAATIAAIPGEVA